MDTPLEIFTKKFEASLQIILDAIDLDSIDDILDARDADAFSDVWIKTWKKVEHVQIDIDTQREKIFKLIFSKTQSSDLAAYLIEDFELIAKHLNQEEDNWVTHLCATYFDHKVPQGKLKSKNITLIELITQ